MAKKIYIIPLSEVTQLGPDVIMDAFGPASMPIDPFAPAPKKSDSKVF